MPGKIFQAPYADLPRELILDGSISRSAVRTDDSLVVFNWISPDFVTPPPHDHPFDQLAFIFAGRAEFQLSGQPYEVAAGEFLYIPAGVPHTVAVVGEEEVLNVDVFAPAREDYLHLVKDQPR